MTLPLTLPSWMPEWLGLILLLVGLVYALAMLAMPFSVFGVKSRLEAIEERLDQVQEDLRILSMRPTEPMISPARAAAIDEATYDKFPRSAAAHYEREAARRAPTPPAPEPYREPLGRARPVAPPPRSAPGRRIEPRLD